MLRGFFRWKRNLLKTFLKSGISSNIIICSLFHVPLADYLTHRSTETAYSKRIRFLTCVINKEGQYPNIVAGAKAALADYKEYQPWVIDRKRSYDLVYNGNQLVGATYHEVTYDKEYVEFEKIRLHYETV